jgi:cell division protein FtsW (lipid II flippase)
VGSATSFHERVDIWLNPFSDPSNNGYQLVQSLLGLGTGGLFGAGPGAGQPTQVPEVRNDFIFAGLGEEIGLFGLTALLVVYLVIVERGLRTAIAVRDSFGKLLAGGLAFTLALASVCDHWWGQPVDPVDGSDHTLHVCRWIFTHGKSAAHRATVTDFRRCPTSG